MSFSIKTIQPNIAMAVDPETTPEMSLVLEDEDSIAQSSETTQETTKTNQETVRTSENSGLVIKTTDNSEDYL